MPRNHPKITHMSKFSSSSSHFSIALPIFAFICFPNPASFGWSLYDFLGVAKWWHWSPFCTFHESPSLVEIQHCQKILLSLGGKFQSQVSMSFLPIPGITGCPSRQKFSVHINIMIILGFLRTWHVSFASEHNSRFYMLLFLCPYHLLHHRFFLDLQKWAEELDLYHLLYDCLNSAVSTYTL